MTHYYGNTTKVDFGRVIKVYKGWCGDRRGASSYDLREVDCPECIAEVKDLGRYDSTMEALNR